MPEPGQDVLDPPAARPGTSRPTRSVASSIAVIDQSRAFTEEAASPVCSRFQAWRQRAEQNRACSRRGANRVPHCSHTRVSPT
jgi:hypothetical protein